MKVAERMLATKKAITQIKTKTTSIAINTATIIIASTTVQRLG